MSYTPGPWSVPHFAVDIVDCNCCFVLCEQYFGSIADVRYKTDEEHNDDPPMEEAKANALLIAAAPDLLEALIKCYDKLQSQDMENTEAGKLALAAITKATTL